MNWVTHKNENNITFKTQKLSIFTNIDNEIKCIGYICQLITNKNNTSFSYIIETTNDIELYKENIWFIELK